MVLHKKICLLSVCKCVLDKLYKTLEGLSRSDQLMKHDEALYSMRSIGDKLSCRINEKNKLKYWLLYELIEMCIERSDKL